MKWILSAVFLLACSADPYQDPGEGGACDPPGAAQCLGDISQLCTAEGQWENLYDCQEYGLECDPELGECDLTDGGADAN